MSSTSPHLFFFFFFFFGNSPLVCSPSFDFCVSGSGIPVAVQENFLGSLAYLIYHHLCYLPSLFILLPWFDASSLLGVKTPFLNDTGKDQKITTDFDKILTFCLARGFAFVLSLGVTTPLITPVRCISYLGCFGKVWFDMLKSIEFGICSGFFSSLRHSDRAYLG